MTRTFLVFAASFLLISGCSKDSADPISGGTPPLAPSHILSISPAPRQNPPATTQDIIAAIDLACNSGARGQHLNFPWRLLEPAPGVFALNDFNNILTYLTTARSFKLEIVISVLNTAVRERPADLMNVPFDSPEMKNRFHALLDALFRRSSTVVQVCQHIR